jgi:hypothetical protein
MKNTLKLLFLSIILSGCGAETVTEAGSDGSIEGTAPAGSSIIVYDSEKEQVASGFAGATGEYSIEIVGYRPTTFWLKSAGGEIARIKENPIALSRSSGFWGVVNYAPKVKNFVHLDYPNTVAAASAEFKKNTGYELNVAARESTDAVSQWVGYDIKTHSSNALHANNVSTMSLADLKSVLLNESIIDVCQSLEEYESLVLGACTITKIADMNHKDILLDGVLNGLSISGDEEIGGNKINEEFVTHEIAIKLLKAVEKHAELLKVQPSEFSSMAESINSEKIDIFNEITNTTQIPRQRPYLSVDGLDLDVNNVHVLGISTFDYIGVKYLYIKADGVEESIDPLSDTHSINTIEMQNGNHLIEITSVNYVGDKTVVFGNINVDNKYEIITTISTGDNLVSGEIDLFAQVNNEQGLQEIRFVVDSAVVGVVTSESVDGTYNRSFDTSTLSDGRHTYQIEVTTERANTYLRKIYFNVDNTKPTFDWDLAEESTDPNVYPIFPVFDRVQTIEFTVYDQNPLTVINFYWNDDVLKSFDPEGEVIDGVMTYTPSVIIDTRSIYEGIHNLKIEAIDSTGNISIQIRRVMVDWNDPILKITTPSDIYFAGPQEITFQASDTHGFRDSTIKVIKVYELPIAPGDYSDVRVVEEVLNVVETAKQGVFTVTPEEGEGGKRRLDVEISDLAGKSANASFFVNYANVAPTIEFVREDISNDTFYYINVPDEFNDEEMESFDLTCTDTRYEVYIESVTPKDLNKTTVYRTNRYRTNYNSCGLGKKIKNYEFSCTMTVVNEFGLQATITNEMKRQKDCR